MYIGPWQEYKLAQGSHASRNSNICPGIVIENVRKLLEDAATKGEVSEATRAQLGNVLSQIEHRRRGNLLPNAAARSKERRGQAPEQVNLRSTRASQWRVERDHIIGGERIRRRGSIGWQSDAPPATENNVGPAPGQWELSARSYGVALANQDSGSAEPDITEARRAESETGARDTPRSAASSRSNFSAPLPRGSMPPATQRAREHSRHRGRADGKPQRSERRVLLRRPNAGIEVGNGRKYKPRGRTGRRLLSDQNEGGAMYDGTSVAQLLRAERRSKLHKNRADLQQFWKWAEPFAVEEEGAAKKQAKKVDEVKNMKDLYMHALQQKQKQQQQQQRWRRSPHMVLLEANSALQDSDRAPEAVIRHDEGRASPHRSTRRHRRDVQDGHEEEGGGGGGGGALHGCSKVLLSTCVCDDDAKRDWQSPPSPSPVGSINLTDNHLQQVAKYFGSAGGESIIDHADGDAVLSMKTSRRRISLNRSPISAVPGTRGAIECGAGSPPPPPNEKSRLRGAHSEVLGSNGERISAIGHGQRTSPQHTPLRPNDSVLLDWVEQLDARDGGYWDDF